MERVFAADYKAATLTMDEVVLQADAVLRLGELALPNAAECLIYARGEGAVRVDTGDGQSMTLAGEAVARWTSSPAALRLTAIDGAAYAILSYAGK